MLRYGSYLGLMNKQQVQLTKKKKIKRKTWNVKISYASSSSTMKLYLHFIHKVALARKQRKDFLVFESSYYLSTTLYRVHTAISNAERQAGKL